MLTRQKKQPTVGIWSASVVHQRKVTDMRFAFAVLSNKAASAQNPEAPFNKKLTLIDGSVVQAIGLADDSNVHDRRAVLHDRSEVATAAIGGRVDHSVVAIAGAILRDISNLLVVIGSTGGDIGIGHRGINFRLDDRHVDGAATNSTENAP